MPPNDPEHRVPVMPSCGSGGGEWMLISTSGMTKSVLISWKEAVDDRDTDTESAVLVEAWEATALTLEKASNLPPPQTRGSKAFMVEKTSSCGTQHECEHSSRASGDVEATAHHKIEADMLPKQYDARQSNNINIEQSQMFSSLTVDTDTALGWPLATEIVSIYWVIAEFLPAHLEEKLTEFLFSDAIDAIDTSSSLGEQESALDVICRISAAAKVVLFLGGMAHFRNRCFQRIYDLVFVTSFLCCLVTCFMNLSTVKAPPFYDYSTDFLITYIHVLGLHAWLYWRGFVKHRQLHVFVRSFFVVLEGCDHCFYAQQKSVIRFTRVVFAMMFICQILLTGVAYTAFPLPAYFHWNDRGQLDLEPFEQHYSLAHSLIMFGVIPQHIPTLLATMGLFFVVARLHYLDMERSQELMYANNVEMLKSCTGVTHETALSYVCFELLEATQARLHYSCSRWQWLWLHQLLFAFFELFVACGHIRKAVTSNSGLNRDDVLLHFADIFHLCYGTMGFGALLLTPAWVTQAFKDSPQHFIAGLRNRGVPITDVAMSVPYLSLTAKGFTVVGETISTSTVVRFVTLVGIAMSLFMSL